MKSSSSLRNKFKYDFVKPLYRRVINNRVKPKHVISVDVKSTLNLYGNGICVKNNVITDTINRNVIVFDKHISCEKKSLAGYTDADIIRTGDIKQFCDNDVHTILRGDMKSIKACKMLENEETNFDSASRKNDGQSNKLIQAENYLQNIPGYWLRVYPLPKHPEESIWSVLFRCLMCQLGLATILILWTFVWVFIIQSFEGPYEIKISLDFEEQQNQLVIDLATELRQITPISLKWKAAIVKRIEDERQLTVVAMANGAKLHPGQFWDLSGTFLFSIYVMTALGFGAPVPQTPWGRTSALIYAVIAVPTHIFLMLNMSTYVVVRTEMVFNKRRRKLSRKAIPSNNLITRGSRNCNRSLEVVKPLNKLNWYNKIKIPMTIFCACRCLPLAIITYYVCGVIVFGVLREREPLDTAMFPLEFTTTGGLEQVEGYVRILYSFYVEGAMTLLALTFATLRRHSSNTIGFLSEKYRLFEVENR